MKKFPLIALLFFFYNVSKADSTDLANIQKKINDLSKIIQNRTNLEDSLKRELNFYKMKEDFYTTALSDQGTRFSLIIAGILSLFGLVSWLTYKAELTKLKSEIQKSVGDIDDGFKNFKSNSLFHEKDLKVASANVYAAIGQLPSLTPADSLYYHLLAANSFWETYKLVKANAPLLSDSKRTSYLSTCISNLGYVAKVTTNLQGDKLNAKNKIENNQAEIAKCLDNLLDSKDHSVISLVIKIKADIQEIMA